MRKATTRKATTRVEAGTAPATLARYHALERKARWLHAGELVGRSASVFFGFLGGARLNGWLIGLAFACSALSVWCGIQHRKVWREFQR